jgi:hypothetical protein
MALCRFAAGPGGIALQRDLQSCLTRKTKTTTISQPVCAIVFPTDHFIKEIIFS